MTGPKSKLGTMAPGVPDCRRIASSALAGCARRQVSGSLAAPQPADVANVAAVAAPSAAVGWRVVQPPLSLIARWKSFLLLGDATCRQVSCEPADSPNIVTRFGFPPNPAMFART